LGEGRGPGANHPSVRKQLSGREAGGFDVYAAWLNEQGWRRQALTDATVTLPHQVWRKDGAEPLIEIRGLDEQGRTVVWLQVEEQRIGKLSDGA
jgi:hypothetical protein